MQAVGSRPIPRCDYRIGTLPSQTTPLVIEATTDRSVDELCAWLHREQDWVQARLLEHGAILFRGFAVEGPSRFEQIARCINPELKNNYLGTSPRDALTEYVFSASELPGFYPIPQHCEMSFTAHPPSHLFFCCLVQPGPDMGETPLVDFRRVWRDLDAGVRQRFEERGIRIVRNYSGPSGGSAFDLFKLKRWDEMFRTTDKSEVERQCTEEGFEAVWGANDSLRLISTQSVYRDHPLSGERAWHNHTQVFHLSAAPGEYQRIYAMRPTWKNWGMLQFSRALVAINRATRTADEQSMHCTHLDGSEIADADMENVRDVIWKHMVANPWLVGDVVAIDNASIAHGRLPYEGPRTIAVCWA